MKRLIDTLCNIAVVVYVSLVIGGLILFAGRTLLGALS